MTRTMPRTVHTPGSHGSSPPDRMVERVASEWLAGIILATAYDFARLIEKVRCDPTP